jgi:hydroxymethylpyrimidine/phosphomethylpyrimidine kinase
LLIKGGHAAGLRSTDILLRPRQQPIRFDAPRLVGSMRGTGCMLASAIAAHLAKTRSLEEAVCQGKQFVFMKLRGAQTSRRRIVLFA